MEPALVPVPVPDPEMTAEKMIARARSLRERLRGEAGAAEQRGTYSDEIHREFLDAGFYRALQPRLFGGYELSIPDYYRLITEVSTGDPGSGWGLALAAGHCFTVGSHYSAQAQADLFGADGDFRAPHRPLPSGTAMPTEGGFMLEGEWEYASSVPHSTHFTGNAWVPETEHEPRRMIIFAVPRRDYTILDDWGHGEVLGLQASGSNSVRIEHAFVPEHLTIPDWGSREFPDGTPGTALHDNPMYIGRVHSFNPGEIVAAIVGAARAALDEYERIIRAKKTIAPPQVLRIEHHDSKRVFGMALSQTDAAEAMLLRAGEIYMDHCRRWATTGTCFRIRDDMRLYGIVMHAGRLAAEAVEMLFSNAGTTVTRRDQPLQRYFRDVSMYRTHFIAQYENLAQLFAGVYFGQEFA